MKREIAFTFGPFNGRDHQRRYSNVLRCWDDSGLAGNACVWSQNRFDSTDGDQNIAPNHMIAQIKRKRIFSVNKFHRISFWWRQMICNLCSKLLLLLRGCLMITLILLSLMFSLCFDDIKKIKVSSDGRRVRNEIYSNSEFALGTGHCECQQRCFAKRRVVNDSERGLLSVCKNSGQKVIWNTLG